MMNDTWSGMNVRNYDDYDEDQDEDQDDLWNMFEKK